jgi:predicted ATPase
MIHLSTAKLLTPATSLPDEFPFNIPVLRAFSELELTSEVTFLVGENGSGKSTLLEALACAVGLPVVGSESVGADTSLAHARRLAKHLRLSWNRRTHNGFFMRAEDFFGFAKKVESMKRELEDDLVRVEQETKGRSELSRALAKSPYAKELGGLRARYGQGLDARSHGEAFLSLFQSRFVPNGLYLLDEPEAPLSPVRQLSFLSLLKGMVAEQNAQFIIATHSPIIMAFPNATIYSLDGEVVKKVRYDEVEHVVVTRDFLANPERFMRQL